MFKLIFSLGVLLLVAAWLTVPSQADAEQELRNQLETALQSQTLTGKDAAMMLALTTCKLQPDACYDLVRRGITLDYENKTFFSQIQIEGFGQEGTCYGVLTKFFCTGGLDQL